MAHYTVENTRGKDVDVIVNGHKVTGIFEVFTFWHFIFAKGFRQPLVCVNGRIATRWYFGIGKVVLK